MKKAPAASAGGESDKIKIRSESIEAESKLDEEAPSSSSSTVTEELQGFTPASELYSVRHFTTHLHIGFLGLQTIHI